MGGLAVTGVPSASGGSRPVERQQRWEQLAAEAERLFLEELDGLARQLMGGVDPAGLLRGLGPALEGLLAGSGVGQGPYRVLGLDPSAPDEVVRLVYRHLAQRCHPDHGGSQEAMALLNRAYEQISNERGWKA